MATIFKRYRKPSYHELVAPNGYWYFDVAYDYLREAYFSNAWNGLYSVGGLTIGYDLQSALKKIEGRSQVLYAEKGFEFKKEQIISTLKKRHEYREKQSEAPSISPFEGEKKTIYDPEFWGAEETPPDIKEKFRKTISTQPNYHIDLLIRKEIISKDIVNWIYSGKINSCLQLRNGKTRKIPIESWINGELEYSFTNRRALLILDTDECSTTYEGNILVRKQDLWTVVKDAIAQYEEFLKSRKVAHEPAYQSPYMQLLKEAIIEHNISTENQPSNKVLVPWFEEKLKTEHNDIKPGNKAKLLATFVRMPESQKGGLRKVKPKG